MSLIVHAKCSAPCGGRRVSVLPQAPTPLGHLEQVVDRTRRFRCPTWTVISLDSSTSCANVSLQRERPSPFGESDRRGRSILQMCTNYLFPTGYMRRPAPGSAGTDPALPEDAVKK